MPQREITVFDGKIDLTIDYDFEGGEVADFDIIEINGRQIVTVPPKFMEALEGRKDDMLKIHMCDCN